MTKQVINLSSEAKTGKPACDKFVAVNELAKRRGFFWSSFAQLNGRACGYNILGFDLPYLLRRSFALNIEVPLMPRLAKYQTEPVVDLMGILYNWGNARGLKWVCKRYGIQNPLPDLDGSQVANMDRDTLRKYAGNDLALLIELYKRMCGVYLPALESYQPAFLPR